MPGSDHSSTPDQQGASGESPPLIPGHQLLRWIGQGSYGEIWLARTELGAFRAVKIVRKANFDTARPYDREFAGIKRYEPISREHDGLVDVLQVGRDENAGFFYYVMELADDAAAARGNGVMEKWCDGAQTRPHHSTTPTLQHPESYTPLTLAHVIHQRQRLPASEVIELGISLARALDFLHSRRLVHRDIKPANIIFVGGQPKLADVGLIADLGSPQSVVGTQGYIPPEGPGSVQADIYSLGKVLYEVATGKDRQEFPDLPTRLGEGHDDPALLELNEVLLKACENNPHARYRSAAALAADLQRLKAGQSLRARRARRRRLRSIAAATALVVGLALLGVGLVATLQYYRSKPRLLFSDDFDGPALDTNYWTPAHLESGHNTTKSHYSSVIEQSGGELVLRASVIHTNGLSTSLTGWVDLERDLRQAGPCRIEIARAGSSFHGFLSIAMTSGGTPTNTSDPGGAKLAQLAPADPPDTNAWRPAQLRVDLFPRRQAAIVYPDTSRLYEFDVVDLQSLPVWHLRFYSFATTASGRVNAFADLRVGRVLVTSRPSEDALIGRVVEEISGWPVPDAVVKDTSGRPLTKTLSNGAFVATPAPKSGRLTFEKSHYASVDLDLRTTWQDTRLLTVRLRKPIPEFGDVVDVIQYGDLPVVAIGFRGDTLWVLANEASDGKVHCRLRLVDTSRREVGVEACQVANAPLNAFADCGGRLIGLRLWNEPAVFDLAPECPPVLLLNLTDPRDGKELRWPMGCAFDGQFLWFAEQDHTKQRYGLHALDLQQLVLTNSLSSTTKGITGLAWDGRWFWISSVGGQVYAVDRNMAQGQGAVEAGIVGRPIRGNYLQLTFGQGHLWGLEPEKRRICKIKITD